jgi:hypothetical protein
VAAMDAHPDMHVYHYAPYEVTAFKRLMGRYATRENELDAMLARVGLSISTPSFPGLRAASRALSIKISAAYDFARASARRETNHALHNAQAPLVRRPRPRIAGGGSRHRRGLQQGRLSLHAPCRNGWRGCGVPSRRGAAIPRPVIAAPEPRRPSASDGHASNYFLSPAQWYRRRSTTGHGRPRAVLPPICSTSTGARTRRAGGSTSSWWHPPRRN